MTEQPAPLPDWLDGILAYLAPFHRDGVQKIRAHIAALEADNKRLREALQFYADGPYYEIYKNGIRQNAVIQADGGKRAKAALAQADK